MAISTHDQIATLISTNITDNANKENTASRVRDVLNEINDSMVNSLATNTSVVYNIKVTIPSASILTGFATPVLCIPAPSSGYAIRLGDCSGAITYNSSAYATNVDIELYTDTASKSQKDLRILNTTVNTIKNFGNLASTSSTEVQLINGKAIYFKVKTGNPTAGNSDLVLYLSYQLIQL